MMDIHDMWAIVDQIEFGAYSFLVMDNERGTIYLQALYQERDIATGKMELQKTRKWILSPHMTKSEIVQTVFKCCLTSMEHRTRETFKYRGKRIFGPHFDVDALHEICTDKRFDYRDGTQTDEAQQPAAAHAQACEGQR